jgi:hypothetical protein
MKRWERSEFPAILAALAFAASVPALAATQPSPGVELRARPDELAFEAGSVYDSLRLTLGGPGGVTFELRGEAAAELFLGLQDADGEPLPDGLYAYELRARTDDREQVLRAGFFSIEEGAFVSPDAEEPGSEGAAGARRPAGLATKDQVVFDDLIVDGSLCVGVDCVNGESFGFSTLRLKENNVRIELLDTSSAGSFPSTDWQIRANESVSGGANLFAVDDLTSGRTPFTIVGTAPDNALFVASTGRIGVGTSVPNLQLHALNGNTPGLRLEQDSSNSFDPQTWDVAGNEVSFFVRDVTHSARIPFRIKPGAPTDSLFVAESGDVGLGTSTPSARLDVAGDVAVSGTVDGRDVAADGATLDAHVTDFDNPHQVTASQAGADPAGTAAGAVTAHEAAFDHGNIPSALPVPVTEGGTGATDAATARANLGIVDDSTKAGIVPAASFAGNPALATVTFATAYPAGTSYVVELTAYTSDAKKVTTANLVARDETGFTVTLGGAVKDLVEVDWLARPVGE